MKSRSVLFILLAVFAIITASGQKPGKRITITGSVTDGTNSPVANAIIMVNGEKTGILTNEKGKFKIKLKPDSKNIGIFTTTNGILEQDISGRNSFDFRFEGSVPSQKTQGTDPMDDVIDTGYGKVRKRAATGSVSKIDGTQAKYASYNSVYDMIRGEVPGVIVNGRSILIRGATSATLSTEPLFVVDGVPVNSIDDIEPRMVKSIQVLKGSSAAIYGSRGSNGVIIINTLVAGDK